MFPKLVPNRLTKETLELRDLIENGVDIWNFEYPSYYKGEEKMAFEKKVNDHFYFRQIGAETVGRFLHHFRRTMREIMPLYIQRYKSVELMDDPEIRPLDNYNMIEEFEQDNAESETAERSGTTSGTGTTTGSSSGGGTKIVNDKQDHLGTQHDTPQSQLSMSLKVGVVEIDHASQLDQSVDQNNSQETSNANESSETSSETSGTSEESSDITKTGNQTHRLTRRGNIGVTTYADLLKGYRESFLNIDMEIINELEICFLGVY